MDTTDTSNWADDLLNQAATNAEADEMLDALEVQLFRAGRRFFTTPSTALFKPFAIAVGAVCGALVVLQLFDNAEKKQP